MFLTVSEVEQLLNCPGGDLVVKGLADMEHGVTSEEALLRMVAGPRLRGLGFEIEPLPNVEEPYEHRLYEAICDRSAAAHMDYNALIGRIVSFAQTYGRSPHSLVDL